MSYGTRLCEWCNRLYTPKRVDQRTCCKECRVRHNRQEQNAKGYVVHKPKPCPVCKKLFTPKRSDKLTCSNSCYGKLTYNHKPVWHSKICDLCGVTFTSKRSDATYCSQRCNGLAYYASNRDHCISSAIAWQQANKNARHVNLARYKARRRGWELDGPGLTAQEWLDTLERYSWQCAYCLSSGPLQVEHVIPLSRGGLHCASNIVPACAACNNSKGSKLLSEWHHYRERIMLP